MAWSSAQASNPSALLRLLDGFELRCEGESVTLPFRTQRVLAFLALHDRPLLRAYVCGSLWLETTEDRARANLRSALWRLHRPGYALIEAFGSQLRLSPDIAVDVREAERIARRLLDATAGLGSSELDQLVHGRELLPGWYDEWVLLERERFRQLRLHALESVCKRLTAEGRFGEATEAGLAAVATEPLRESANRVLIEAHLAEGNVHEARAQYRKYRDVLHQELDVEPSAEWNSWAAGFTAR
jgi:DNA-binding SARP family transcriptional activator